MAAANSGCAATNSEPHPEESILMLKDGPWPASNDTIAKLFHEWGWKVTVYDGAE